MSLSLHGSWFDGWEDGRMGGRKDGRMEGWKWKDGSMEGWKMLMWLPPKLVLLYYGPAIIIN